MEELLQGASIRVDTTLFPSFTVDLSSAVAGEASPLTKALKPRVTVIRNGVTLYRVAPHGDPGSGLPLLLLAGAILFLLFFAAK